LPRALLLLFDLLYQNRLIVFIKVDKVTSTYKSLLVKSLNNPKVVKLRFKLITLKSLSALPVDCHFKNMQFNSAIFWITRNIAFI